MRRFWAILLNGLAPGAGLIILRREWLGSLLSILFAMLMSNGLAGFLLVPLLIPGWMATLCLALAVLIWCCSQWLLFKRIRETCSPGIAEELSSLCQRAKEAQQAEDYDKARQLLQVAMSVNDEDIEVNKHWASLMTVMKEYKQARKAWHRVRRLHETPEDRRIALDALEALPA